jgi:hypothetical protein
MSFQDRLDQTSEAVLVPYHWIDGARGLAGARCSCRSADGDGFSESVRLGSSLARCNNARRLGRPTKDELSRLDANGRQHVEVIVKNLDRLMR